MYKGPGPPGLPPPHGRRLSLLSRLEVGGGQGGNLFTHGSLDIHLDYGSLSFFTFTSPARIVAISPCMKAQGTLDPTKGHFSPLGQ